MVTAMDGADIVTQLVKHVFQISQAMRIGLDARCLLTDLAQELAPTQVEDLAGAVSLSVIGGIAHQAFSGA
jgi:hypothetical protein